MRLLLILLATAALLPLPARAGELRAGVAKVDITPPVVTPLGGYQARLGKPSTGKHDPIHAKALVLDDGTTRLAILTTDLVGTNPKMAQKVAELSGFPREKLLISASHTHSGPGAYGEGPFAIVVLGGYRQTVFNSMAEGMARALKEAVANLRPAALAIGESKLPKFMRNRRKARIKDPALWVMRVDTRDGKPLAALVNLTAHGTVLDERNLEFSGDWMTFTQAYLESEVPGLTALYTNGAEGDISPNIPDNSSHFDGARQHGELGGRAALELYNTLTPKAEVKLSAKTAALTLPKTTGGKLLGAAEDTTLQYLSINNAILIAVPGEPITRLGLLLKEHARRQGYPLPVIVGLANDHLGYFLTRGEMKKGGYEAGMSFFGEGFGEELTLALGALIGGDAAPLKEGLAEANRQSAAADPEADK
jgi:hypothetical protein